MIMGERTHVQNILMGERTLCERADAKSRGGERTFYHIFERLAGIAGGGLLETGVLET